MLNKRLYIIYIFFLLTKSYGQSIEVCTTCTIKTVSEAVSMAKPHDTIILNKGVYNEHDILIDKPLRIVGKNQPIIDGNKKGYVLIVKSDSVFVSGLTVKNPGQSYTKDYAAIYISRSKYFSFKDNTLENVFFGFLIEKSHHGSIINNHISSEAVKEASSGNGVHLWHCSNIRIEKNEVSKLRDGIYLEFVKESKIINNLSYNNLRYGLHFMFSNQNE